jgi:hypothetical protein
MRCMPISTLTVVMLLACSSADQSTGPSPTDSAESTTGSWLARGGNGDQLSSSFTGSAVLSFTADLAGTARINLITGAGTGEFTLQGTLTY